TTPAHTTFPYTTLFRSPHHSEHDREAARKYCVKSSEEYPLHDGVDDGHAGCFNPKYAPTTRSRSREAASPSSTMRPSSMQITRRSEEHTSELQSPDHLV